MTLKHKAALRDAVEIAYSMLVVIQKGGSYSTLAWQDRMRNLEAALGPAIAHKISAETGPRERIESTAPEFSTLVWRNFNETTA